MVLGPDNVMLGTLNLPNKAPGVSNESYLIQTRLKNTIFSLKNLAYTL